ncbi:MAG: hexitol phosphatase HxpB [Pseudomonadota bacterium]
MLEAIIYDLDGVIIESEPLWRIAEIESFNSIGIDLPIAECEKMKGVKIDEFVLSWYSFYKWDLNVLTTEEMTNKIVERFINLIIQKGKQLPGLMYSLEFFKSKGYKMAIASSSNMKIILTVLEKFGIKSYFNEIHSAESEEYGKPHPAVYINCAKKLNVDPSQCLAIEDSENGVLAAKAAKMKCISVSKEELSLNKIFLIADFNLKSLNQINENLLLPIL